MTDTVAQLAAKLTARITAAAAPRFILGITGPPGSGKSTLAEDLAVACLFAVPAVVVTQDGFHLLNAALDARNLRARKGAPESFDVQAFVQLLRDLHRTDRAIAAPIYDRELHEPIPDRITVEPAVRLVIVEGNYLLHDAPHWRDISALLDETWFLDTPLETCMHRVHARHVAGGLTAAQATEKINTNDRPNAQLIAATASRADHVISLTV